MSATGGEIVWQGAGAWPEETQDCVLRLFGELREPLLRYLCSLGLNRSDGEDVVQEAFLALHQHMLEGKAKENLAGWVFRVARNKGLKKLERAARWNRESKASPIEPGANPEELALSATRKQRIIAVVEALAPQDRECLRLKAAGFRYREIAEILGISLGGVAQSVARSLTRLRPAAER